LEPDFASWLLGKKSVRPGVLPSSLLACSRVKWRLGQQPRKREDSTGASMKPSTDGIILIDSSSFKPIYANPRAIEIFSYPEEPRKIASPDRLLAERIREFLINKRSSDRSAFVSELRIGITRYSCQAFRLNSPLFLVVLRPQTSDLRARTSDHSRIGHNGLGV